MQLNVTDPEASAAWYSAALGLEPFAADPGHRLRGPDATGPPGWWWCSPGATAARSTTPPGVLDHLAFAVPDGASLEAWAAT